MNSEAICTIGKFHAALDRRRLQPSEAVYRPRLDGAGERRAVVPLKRLETVWFNTGTLCNIDRANCYIESSPKNDRLSYLTLDDVVPFLDEIA